MKKFSLIIIEVPNPHYATENVVVSNVDVYVINEKGIVFRSVHAERVEGDIEDINLVISILKDAIKKIKKHYNL